MRLVAGLAVLTVVACARERPAARVELAPLPSVAPPAELVAKPDDNPACEPGPLAVVEPDPDGGPSALALRERISAAKAFAERCCTGDETGELRVTVTLAPDGYETKVDLAPPPDGASPARACVAGAFHRIIAKGFPGDPVTVIVPVHLGN